MVRAIIHHNNRQKTPTRFCAGSCTFIQYNPLIRVRIPKSTVNIVRIDIILFVLIVVSVSETSNNDSVFSCAIDTRDNILSVLYNKSSK